MASSIGIAVIQFPGFPAIEFHTVDLEARTPRAPGLSWTVCPSLLPSRKIKAADGRVLVLSRKERTRLMTLLKKWNHDRGYDGHYSRVRVKESFRTIKEENLY
jgi:hypothetical protein